MSCIHCLGEREYKLSFIIFWILLLRLRMCLNMQRQMKREKFDDRRKVYMFSYVSSTNLRLMERDSTKNAPLHSKHKHDPVRRRTLVIHLVTLIQNHEIDLLLKPHVNRSTWTDATFPQRICVLNGPICVNNLVDVFPWCFLVVVVVYHTFFNILIVD